MKISRENTSSGQGSAQEIKIETGLHPATIVAAIEGASTYQGQRKEGFWVVFQVKDSEDEESPIYWLNSKFLTPFFNSQTNAGKLVSAITRCEFTDVAIADALLAEGGLATEENEMDWSKILGAKVTVNLSVNPGKKNPEKKFLSYVDVSKASKRLGTFDADTSKSKIPSFIASPFDWEVTDVHLLDGFCVYDFKEKKALYGEAPAASDDSDEQKKTESKPAVKPAASASKAATKAAKEAPKGKQEKKAVEDDDEDDLPF